jgi:phage terminase Nu1 subunit (DNA packaging protein)
MANENASPTVPVGTLAKLFNLTDMRVQQLAKLGVVIKGERGRYDLWGSVRGYVRYLQDRAAGRSGGDAAEGGNYEAHRARLYAARADKAEEEAKLIKGKSHDAETVAEVMNQFMANIRARLLALPTQTAPLVANSDDPNTCKAILTDAMHEALSELANYPAAEIHARQLRREVPTSSPDDLEEDAP